MGRHKHHRDNEESLRKKKKLEDESMYGVKQVTLDPYNSDDSDLQVMNFIPFDDDQSPKKVERKTKKRKTESVSQHSNAESESKQSKKKQRKLEQDDTQWAHFPYSINEKVDVTVVIDEDIDPNEFVRQCMIQLEQSIESTPIEQLNVALDEGFPSEQIKLEQPTEYTPTFPPEEFLRVILDDNKNEPCKVQYEAFKRKIYDMITSNKSVVHRHAEKENSQNQISTSPLVPFNVALEDPMILTEQIGEKEPNPPKLDVNNLTSGTEEVCLELEDHPDDPDHSYHPASSNKQSEKELLFDSPTMMTASQSVGYHPKAPEDNSKKNQSSTSPLEPLNVALEKKGKSF